MKELKIAARVGKGGNGGGAGDGMSQSSRTSSSTSLNNVEVNALQKSNKPPEIQVCGMLFSS